LLAWRAVLGLRHSWLSREILAFGLFAGAATAASASTWSGGPPALTGALDGVVAVTGVAGVLCSVQLYAVTRRRWWSFARTFARFGLSTLAGGASVLVALVVFLGTFTGGDVERTALLSGVGPLAVVLIGATVAGLLVELSVLVPFTRRGNDELERSARLLVGDLRDRLIARVAAGLIGGVVLMLVVMANAESTSPAMGVTLVAALASTAAVIGGALIERRLFFLAVSAPRMPGVLR